MLSQGFSKLDLVTREEFDTQAQVLARTRVRLENSRNASRNSSRSSPRRKPDALPGRKVRARPSCGPRAASSTEALKSPYRSSSSVVLRSTRSSLFIALRSPSFRCSSFFPRATPASAPILRFPRHAASNGRRPSCLQEPRHVARRGAQSRAASGRAPDVTVEVHLANGLPSFSIVGLPDLEVRESRERVRAALQNCGFEFPVRRITVNLAPADLPKESGRFDLPIALGILAANGQIPADALAGREFAGELSLTGALRPMRGAFAMACGVARDGQSAESGAALGSGSGTLSGSRRTPRAVPATRQRRRRARAAASGRARSHAPDLSRHLLDGLPTPRSPTWSASAAPPRAGSRGRGRPSHADGRAAGAGKSMLAARLPGLRRR